MERYFFAKSHLGHIAWLGLDPMGNCKNVFLNPFLSLIYVKKTYEKQANVTSRHLPVFFYDNLAHISFA